MPISVPVSANFQRLQAQEDIDGDRRITVRDKGPKLFQLEDATGSRHPVRGTYPLSNLLQELAAALHAGVEVLDMELSSLEENPRARLERTIRDRCWHGLTRSLQRDRLGPVLADAKGDGRARLYIPHADQKAWDYYRDAPGVECIRLPAQLTADYALSLNPAPGLLSLALDDNGLPLPYVVPGGRFNEMYGWDSYFIGLGLLHDGRHDLARALVDHFVYQIEHYGKILNANRTYYLTRSQPPFLTAFARAVRDSGAADDAWLGRCLRAATREYEDVWRGPSRLVAQCGLSRYFCLGIGMPPETLMRHYGAILEPHARRAGISTEEYRRAYQLRQIVHPDLDAYFSDDRAVRESGHDTSHRLESRCTRLCTVDLNSLLYRYETDLADTVHLHGVGTAERWRNRAEQRRAAMTRLCWEHNSFFDYDWVAGRHTGWQSCTNLFPLWAGLATPEQARRMVEEALPLYAAPGGIVSGTEASRGELSATRTARQWDFPYGWAPHQMLLWEGLRRYGYAREAALLAGRWLEMITQNAVDFNGVIPEKFDVQLRSHEVFAEYVNVGADFAYLTEEGFGWTNASYQVGQTYLDAEQLARLEAIRSSDSSP